MIKKVGTPCLFSGEFEYFIAPDAQLIIRPSYFNYDVVYITAETIAKISPLWDAEFGCGETTPESIMSWTQLPENLTDYGHLKPVEFEGQILYPDCSGWLVK